MAAPAYTTLYYNQTLDHTQPFHHSSPRWSHRYLLNDDSWGKPSDSSITSSTCPGPLLLYTGNEGPIDAFWSGNGFMMQMADLWGGLILFPEERYYGESIPSSDYSYMSTQQVRERERDFISAASPYDVSNATNLTLPGPRGLRRVPLLHQGGVQRPGLPRHCFRGIVRRHPVDVPPHCLSRRCPGRLGQLCACWKLRP